MGTTRSPGLVRRAAAIVVAGSALLASVAHGKDPLTTCADVCDTLTSTSCVVSAVHDVTPGSVVDCTAERAIQIDGGELRVHDGQFTLRGKSLQLLDGGQIIADCPQDFEQVGFAIDVQETLSFVSNDGGKLSARCEVAGGTIQIDAGGNVIVSALGIDASGTDADAPGGSVSIDAGGYVLLYTSVVADAGGGTAPGGSIEIRSDDDISVQAELRVKGYGGTSIESPGGAILLDAGGDVSVTDGTGLKAETSAGAGGDVTILAAGLVDLRKPVQVSGTTGPSGMGGAVRVEGDEVKVDHDIIANGGRSGGTIGLEARSGGVSVGTSSQLTKLEANGDNGEPAGEITMEAQGSGVTLGGNARLKANGVGGGSTGGAVHLAGVDVTTNSSAQVEANGANPNDGGIYVEARGVLTLAGTIQANNGGTRIFTYRAGTPSIDSGITGHELVQRASLNPPCGDGVRAGTEECDGADLDGETCASQSAGTGALACADDCTFDTSGCSGS
jgi:hypothetical protein